MKRHSTEWGESIYSDGERADAVREFVVGNAAYWIRAFHLDGLRIDASQAIIDDSQQHIIAVLGSAAREVAGKRQILIFAEDQLQRVQHVEPLDKGGFALDGLWNDDLRHACRVAATGHAEYYYSDYNGLPQEIISAARFGHL